MLPVIYLEKFLDIRRDVLEPLQLAQRLFSQLRYQEDDIFKIWVAEKKEQDIPLIVGQHGGHFGIGKLNQTVDHQLLISAFGSWGGDSLSTKIWSLCQVCSCQKLKI